MIPYTPSKFTTPERVLADVPSGWRGLETILGSIVEQFCPKTDVMVDMGVETGFSTAAFSNYFKWVIGVDHFKGDTHAGLTPYGLDRYTETKERLSKYPNIHLLHMPWEAFAGKNNDAHYDLIHVDMFHDFETTFSAGMWAARHSTVTLFHDTMWFAEVAPAVEWVAKCLGKKAYNFNDFNGLAILV